MEKEMNTCVKSNIIMQQNSDRSVREQEGRNREQRGRERETNVNYPLYWLFRSIWYIYSVLSEQLWKLTGNLWLKYALSRPTGNIHYALQCNTFVTKTCIPFSTIELSCAKLLPISQYITCNKYRQRKKQCLKELWSKWKVKWNPKWRK